MKIRFLPLAAALALCLSPLASFAQASAPPASVPAAATKTGPRLLTPAETRNSATVPGDLRPEHPVTPQISIPLGRKPPPAGVVPAPPRGNAAPGAGVDDAAARCEAQVGEQVRAKCRDKLAREARARPPG